MAPQGIIHPTDTEPFVTERQQRDLMMALLGCSALIAFQ
jgi:hypothetical protein